jgi:endonuclease/exonuclease/phosphatase family metal-dependent hydrolase
VGYAVYGALVLAFVAGYAAKYVRPGMLWWLQLLAIPLPYVSGLVVLGALPMLLARNWILLALHVGLIVLVGIRFFPVGGAANPSDYGMGEVLSVMTLNYPIWPVNDTERRSREMMALVQRERPDLIALQEGWSRYGPDGNRLQARPDVSLLTDSASYMSYGPRRPDRSVSNVPIFSLFPLEAVHSSTLLPGSDGSGAEVMRAEARWRQRALVVFNVHLQSFGSDKPWREDNSSWANPRMWIRYLRQYRDAIVRRAEQAEQLAAMIAEETEPVVVVGDFNSTRNNWDFNWIAAGLRDAFEVAGSGRGATYHARYPFARIDFVLVSEEFAILSAQVPKVVISDHRPVIATLAWRQ